jgi:DNA polymerase elongation subunit (family B)
LYVESRTESDAKSLYGTNLKKKYFRTNGDRRKFATTGGIKRLFENLSCDQQFLMDMYWTKNTDVDFSKDELVTYFIDIETYSPDDFPTPDRAKDCINVITVYDTSIKKFITWGTKRLKKSIDNVDYRYCPTEREMLMKFVNFIQTKPPDIISGWNSQFFDIPYIVMRVAKILGDDEHQKLSPVENVYCRQVRGKFGNEQTRWYISGISSLDYLDVYQKFSPGIKESYKLDAIAEEELGDKKIDYGNINLAELADQDWQTFVEYNVQDVNLLVKMDDKLRYLELLRMLAYTGLTTLEGGMGTLGVVTGAASIEARKQGLVMPTFVKEEKPGKNPGAYVGEPVNGFQQDIISFDANSLYPNTMISLNMSPETKVAKITHKDDKCIHLRHTSGKSYELSHEKFKQYIIKDEIAVSKAGILFSQKNKGIIPQIVDDLYAKRVEVKKRLTKLRHEYVDNKSKKIKREIDQLDIEQYTIKILINSIYGYFGNKMAPFGDDDIASSITLTGQAVIKQSNKIITEYVKRLTGDDTVNPIIYNDTDSSYVSLKSVMDSTGNDFAVDGKVTKQAYVEAEKLEDYLNIEILKWGSAGLNSNDCRFVFKRECMGDVGIFLQKKRYVLHVLDDEGIACSKYKYTGVEVVRSTLPKTIKPMVKSVIETMMSTQSLADTNKIFRETYETFKKLPIEDIAFVMGLRDYDKYASKCNGYQVCKGMPIHVKAAYHYNMLIEKLDITNRYESISSGDKVRYYYVNLPNKLGIASLAYKQYIPDEFKKDFPPDTQLMFDKIVYSIIDRFYNAVNWQLTRPNKQMQTDLFELLS